MSRGSYRNRRSQLCLSCALRNTRRILFICRRRSPTLRSSNLASNRINNERDFVSACCVAIKTRMGPSVFTEIKRIISPTFLLIFRLDSLTSSRSIRSKNSSILDISALLSSCDSLCSSLFS